MRGGRDRVHFVHRMDVIAGDSCGCSANDENTISQQGAIGKMKETLCTNSTAFEEWIATVRRREAATVTRRHEQLLARKNNQSRPAIANASTVETLYGTAEEYRAAKLYHTARL